GLGVLSPVLPTPVGVSFIIQIGLTRESVFLPQTADLAYVKQIACSIVDQKVRAALWVCLGVCVCVVVRVWWCRCVWWCCGFCGVWFGVCVCLCVCVRCVFVCGVCVCVCVCVCVPD